MTARPPVPPARQGVASLWIASVVAAIHVTYLITAALGQLGSRGQQVFQLLLFTGAGLSTFGVVLAIRGATQADRATQLSIVGLLFNISILIGYVVIHTSAGIAQW